MVGVCVYRQHYVMRQGRPISARCTRLLGTYGRPPAGLVWVTFASHLGSLVSTCASLSTLDSHWKHVAMDNNQIHVQVDMETNKMQIFLGEYTGRMPTTR